MKYKCIFIIVYRDIDDYMFMDNRGVSIPHISMRKKVLFFIYFYYKELESETIYRY